jgi:hypothetical protein
VSQTKVNPRKAGASGKQAASREAQNPPVGAFVMWVIVLRKRFRNYLVSGRWIGPEERETSALVSRLKPSGTAMNHMIQGPADRFVVVIKPCAVELAVMSTRVKHEGRHRM